MRVLDTIRRNPVAGLAIVAAGIGGWIAAGLLDNGPPSVEPPPGEMSLRIAEVPRIPPPPGSATVSLAVLPKLKLGMTRVEVEDLLGPPTADAVQPVTVIDGRLRYRAAYDLGEPDPPATIRPIRRPRLPMPIPDPPLPRVALEFDASKPGHPLVEVLYLDPLF
jgi:hypothetical protein